MSNNQLGTIIALGVTCVVLVRTANAQNSSLFSREAPVATPTAPQRPSAGWPPGGEPIASGHRMDDGAPMTLRNGSLMYIPASPPREIQKHDIVSVRVDILARMQADGEMQRRKNALYDANLKDWIVFDGFRAVRPDPQSEGDPRVRGELKSNYRSLGELETRESLAFNLAAEVVDIRPNGNLVLEGRAKVVLNDEMWTYLMTGICRPEAIGPNNVVMSRDIIDLDIRKVETGSVAAGYQRGWFQKLFDLVQPF
ncbi:MAG: flagellar basal body L-ring protein FlgH [Planctomycetes bacterium]|nr:flagellar basal body L-ring protein FlgH [Planctomycetota bacterium]